MSDFALNSLHGRFAQTCAPFTLVSRQLLVSCLPTVQISLSRPSSAMTIGVVPQYLGSLEPWDAVFSPKVVIALGSSGVGLPLLSLISSSV